MSEVSSIQYHDTGCYCMGEWAANRMQRAKMDLLLATHLESEDVYAIYGRAFHAQQAAEKSIQAVIAASGTEPKWIHNLVELAQNLPQGCRVGVSENDLAYLSKYAIIARYGNETITKQDADRALDIATTIMNSIQNQL